MLQRFDSKEEVLSETKTYLETKDKTFYNKRIKLLEKRWNQCITLKGDYVGKLSRILSKSCGFISSARDLLSDV